jgi:small GTP-binding protein
MLLEGDGVELDYVEARRWALAAAERGIASSMTRLGMIFHNALGVDRDPVHAALWWQRGAERGDADGQAMLGAAYHLGAVVPRDPVEAFAWLLRARAGGSALAGGARWPFSRAGRTSRTACGRAAAAVGVMIIGTAGHIDHGKTALVRALTGVDTDRLKEEKARGISIDLGFAYLPSPDGSVLGFVDVPGHEKFVHNMLAGATGIDIVLLVVAVDDGIMPQTREHLAIVDLLGIVVLTKADLAGPIQRAQVTDEIKQLLDGTALASANILPASTITAEGIGELRERLFEVARTIQARTARGRFRLAVDRSFTLAGAGTVITGTVLSGAVTVGDRIAVSPSGLVARVRLIHAQHRPADRGVAGERCAPQSCRRWHYQGCDRARPDDRRPVSARADRSDRFDLQAARHRIQTGGPVDAGPSTSPGNGRKPPAGPGGRGTRPECSSINIPASCRPRAFRWAAAPSTSISASAPAPNAARSKRRNKLLARLLVGLDR